MHTLRWIVLGDYLILYKPSDTHFVILPGCESGIPNKQIDFFNTVGQKGVVGVRRETLLRSKFTFNFCIEFVVDFLLTMRWTW